MNLEDSLDALQASEEVKYTELKQDFLYRIRSRGLVHALECSFPMLHAEGRQDAMLEFNDGLDRGAEPATVLGELIDRMIRCGWPSTVTQKSPEYHKGYGSMVKDLETLINEME